MAKTASKKAPTKAKKQKTASKKSVKTVTSKPSASQKPKNPNLFLVSDALNFNDTQAMEKIMTQGKTQMENFTQEATNMGREGAEAFSKSLAIFTKGFEKIMKETASMAQSAAEKQTQYMKEAMGSKTLNEWADVQNRIAQANFDEFMAGATKISELSVKIMTEASEPINGQITKAVEKARTAAAA